MVGIRGRVGIRVRVRGGVGSVGARDPDDFETDYAPREVAAAVWTAYACVYAGCH